MSESPSPVEKKPSSTAARLALVVLIVAAIIYLLWANAEKIGAILMVLFGFGGVIMVHEFGHFIVGKLTGMKITAFSIGFSPVLIGLRRTLAGWHVRILPTLVPKTGGEPEQGALDFTLGKSTKEWDTEYRIGLIPFGGFVALMGQEDVGVAETSDDPRSFANKPLLARLVVILAGVMFNAISALVIFMVIFHNGILLQAPVVGGVIANSPADRAGLRAGDEIVSIEGETFIDFMNISLAAALGDPNEPVHMMVRRTLADGATETFPVSMTPQRSPGAGIMALIRTFGILQSPSLEIDTLADDNERERLLRNTGLMEKDRVIAVNGRPISNAIEFSNVITHLLTPETLLTVERTDPNTKAVSQIELKERLALNVLTADFEGNIRTDSVLGMTPRLMVDSLPSEPNGFRQKTWAWLKSLLYGTRPQLLRPGDIFVRVGQCEYPTYVELRAAMTDYTNDNMSFPREERSPMTVIVERMTAGESQEVTLEIMPELPDDSNKRDLPSTLGFIPGVDVDHPAIAEIVASPHGLAPDSIPRGATITSIGATPVNPLYEAILAWRDQREWSPVEWRRPVKSFYDIIAIVRDNAGKDVTVNWQKGDIAGTVSIDVPPDDQGITVRSVFAQDIPFGDLRRLYKADSPGQSIVMGWKRTELFITQAVVTLSRLISRSLPARTLSGPVGIVKATYTVASEGKLTLYFYWLGLISASIAVMNLLPLPILDGGVIVLMLIEKIKGSPISERVQAAINYVGLALLLALMLYVTFNDIRTWFQ